MALPLVGILFADLASIKKMIPISSPWPFIGILILIGVALFFKPKKKTGVLPLTKPSPRKLAMLLLLSAAGWVMDLFALSLLTRAEGVPLSELMIALIAVSMASLPPLPWGRWGLYEGILGAALHQSGIPIERALALAVVFHLLVVLPYAVTTFALWIRDKTAQPAGLADALKARIISTR